MKSTSINQQFGKTIKWKHGFTLVELIVVMAILSVMTMMAVPRYLGYTTQAKDKKIIHDIKVLETTLDMYLFNHTSFSQIEGFNEVSPSSFAGVSPDLIYSGDGKNAKIEGAQFYIVPESAIKKESGIAADGTFVTNEKGTVYYLKIHLPKKTLLDIFNSVPTIENKDSSYLEIIEVSMPKGYLGMGDKVEGSIKVKALQSGTYYSATSVTYDSKNQSFSSTDKNSEDWHTFEKDEIYTFNFYFTIGVATPPGYLDILVKLRKSTGSTSYIRLYEISVDKSVYVSGSNWKYYPKSTLIPQDRNVIVVNGTDVVENPIYRRAYSINNPILGETSIDGQKAGTVQVQIKPNDTITGSVRIDENSPYGTYETRMNLPSSKALLNSFFLYYNDPVTSNEYEIDIEIYYRYGKWMFSTAIYNEAHPEFDRLHQGMNNPGQVHSKKVELPFDPTLDYHTYRIDYYPNHIAFYMDDKEMVRWNESFEFFYMQPRVTSYYADWLDSEPISSVADTMDVSWIRTKLID